MATRSPSLRARDIDRTVVATALDNAYADGQLTFEEHRDRTERARTAKTLGQLHVLAADLQADVPLPEATARPRRRSRIPLLAAAAVIVVAVVVLIVVLATGGSDEAVSDDVVASPTRTVAPASGAVVPIVAQPFSFTTGEGLEDFRRRYLERFGGDPIVYDLSIYPSPDDNRASIERPAGDGRYQSVSVRGGFDVSAEPGLVDRDDLTFDLNQIDMARFAGHLAGAATFVGVPDAVVSHTVVRNMGEPEILIYASDDLGRGGYFETTLAGEVTAVNPYRP